MELIWQIELKAALLQGLLWNDSSISASKGMLKIIF